MSKQLKAKVEQIIRTNSIPFSQEGYEMLGSHLSIREYIHPAEFNTIHANIDWLSQNGYEGN